jgi:hypothetical protein
MLRGVQAGSTCYLTTCWSLSLVGDQVFVVRGSSAGRDWRIGSPVIMGSSLGAWRRALDTSTAPVLQLDGTQMIVVMVPNGPSLI